MTRPWCSTCRHNVLTGHYATESHRRRVRAATARPAAGRGRPTWMTALRDWDHQYDDRDPGNSPEWDAAMKGA